MGRNQLLLTIISVVCLIISGGLFYQGLFPDRPNSAKLSEVSIQQSSPNSSVNQVLGESSTDSTASATKVLKTVKVTKVVDGDTIEVEMDGNKQKVRYIGINTPETVDPRRPVQCFGKEASNENKRLVEGQEVILEKDISETDKFGRLLRFVYLPLSDGSKLFINDYLVRQGFALNSVFPPDVKLSEQFKEAEKEARENQRGLWGSCK